ncbi:hypothetical protein D3C76_1316330 [compost metagenome]
MRGDSGDDLTDLNRFTDIQHPSPAIELLRYLFDARIPIQQCQLRAALGKQLCSRSSNPRSSAGHNHYLLREIKGSGESKLIHGSSIQRRGLLIGCDACD